MDDTTARESSGALLTFLLAHVRRHAGDDAAREVLRRAGLEGASLDARHGWFSYATRVRLYEAAVDVVGDPGVVHDAGRDGPANGADYTLLLAVRRLGGVRGVYRVLPRIATRLTRVNTIAVTALSATSAEVEYATAPGYAPHRLDCAMARGLIGAVPTIFGRRHARVVETRCQADGHDSCRFSITFERDNRWRRRDAGSALEARATRAQMEQLQLAASDLVGSEDVGEALDRIVERAVTAVTAPAHLLVLTDDAGRPTAVRQRGLDDTVAARLAIEVAAGAPGAGRGITVVDVASTRRVHGRLAVVHGEASGPTEGEVALLNAYARHAAAALDLLTALEEARDRGAQTAALLALAESLAAATDAEGMSRVLVQALRAVAGCDSASVYLWDPGAGELRRALGAGHALEALERLGPVRLRVDEVPEIGVLLTRRETMLLEPDTTSPPVRAVMEAIGSQVTMAIPLIGDDALLGLVTANWSDPERADESAAARANAVCRQGSIALEKLRLIDRLQHQEKHDALSGLPNRALFTKVLGERLRATGPGQGVAVLFCDIDRFKAVNDEMGHAAGDELLRQVAARLRGICRPTDVLGRMSGDEFALVVQDVDEAGAVAVARRILEAIEVPFRIEGREVRITVSVGIAVHEGPDGWGDRLLAAADDGMHVAKSRGRNEIAVAGAVADRRVVPSLEAELGRAADNDQLRLYFQPLVDVSRDGGNVVVGAEALLRWAHPRLGLLAPGAFLPLAEDAGLVTELDLWAIDAACAQLAQWPTREGGRSLSVAVNLAGSTLVDPRLAGAVRAALQAHDIEPSRLHLEVVESRSLVDLPGVVEHLAELRQMGVQIALDDFGTGYSTLAWLQALPVDQVKIDRSFVRRLPDDSASLAVVRGVVALAEEIGLAVVAEGVETQAQLDALRAAGCRWVQGYLLGRPGPVLQFEPATQPTAEPAAD